MDRIKPLYNIKLNWYGEIFNLFVYAFNEKEAMLKGFRQLAKKLKVLVVRVNQYYKKHPDGWKVVKEEAWRKNKQ